MTMQQFTEKSVTFVQRQTERYTDYQIKVAVDKSVKVAHAKANLDRHRISRQRFHAEIISIAMTIGLAFALAAFVHFPDFVKIALDASPEGTRALLQRLKLL